MRRIRWFANVAGLLAAGALIGGQAETPRVQVRAIDLQAYRASLPPFECATPWVRALRLGLATAAPLSDGEPLFFRQDPPLLTAHHAGNLTLREFLVAGDFPTVQFRRYDPGRSSELLEVWNRTGTRSVGGRTVSVFQPSWPEGEFDRILRQVIYGYDYPRMLWGDLIVPNRDPRETRQVWLRMASSNMPSSRVVRIDDTAQYASHVVNLVMPGFGDSRLDGGDDEFRLRDAARKFFERFQDAHDSIAFVPQATHVVPFGGIHQNVRNDVRGIGEQVFNNASQYGSAGTLQSVEFYPQVGLPTNDASNHEIAHQWSNYINWRNIAGITGAGHEPAAHAPLWAPGETMIGAVLEATRRVRQASGFGLFPPALDGADFEVESTPAPIRFHQIEMYAMGKLAQDQVSDLMIFQEQGQFKAHTSSSPDPGTRLRGAVKTVNINDILREHGTRSGPSPSEWRRATVVVSRDGLMSQAEMDYWNFYAQRLEDPGRTGVMSWDGYVGFDAATGNAVDLKTDVTPKSGEKIVQALDVSYPRFGAQDWRGVQLDNPMPSRFRVGERVTVTGRVTATDRRDFNQVLIWFFRSGGTSSNAIQFFAPISGGRFTVDLQFNQGQRGLYFVYIVLFWPDSGPQQARSVLSPAIIE